MTEIKYLKNRENLIGLGALFLMYFLLLRNIFHTNGVWNLPSGVTLYVLLIFSIFIRIIPAYFAFKNSKEMNRSPLIWSVFTFITPFWSLVILSKLNYNFNYWERQKCNLIIKEYKSKLKSLIYDSYWKEVDKQTFMRKRLELENEYNGKLRQVLN